MEPERNKGGRPPGRIYPCRVEAYLTPEEEQEAEALARRRGLSLSGLIRDLLRQAVAREGGE